MVETATYRALVAKMAAAGGCPVLRDLHFVPHAPKRYRSHHMPVSARPEPGMPHEHGAQPRWGI